jgi:peptidoglycan-N-acetylglucosamine deacetylase
MASEFLDVGLFLLLVVLLYTVIPDLFLHRLGIGSWKRQFGPGVCLTFDDGPDPIYTTQVLKTLSKYNASGVFFLVGEQAECYPELVEQILREGHQIGAHGGSHRYAWFMSPWTTWRTWDKCIATLERISGQPVEWVRPPWGTFNLATVLWCRVRGKRAVLWGAEGHDWQVARSPLQITTRILNRIREGTIVVLHDRGGERGAPENSLKALDLLCQKIIYDKKLPLVPLKFPDWSKGRILIFKLWEVWERIFAYFNPTQRISSQTLFKVCKIKYSGPILYGESGQILAQSGDTVGEIHLDSIRLSGDDGDTQSILFRALKQFKTSMPELAQFVVENQEFQEVKVFLGFTFMNRGVKLLGFQVQELPRSSFNRWIGLIQKGVLRVYHPQGNKRGTNRLGEMPKVVFISRETLLDKWLHSVS